MENNILTVRNVNVSYKNQKKNIFSKTTYQHVLKDVSFEMKEGEILGLVGESGCGKSTLAKAILGLVPYTGEIVHASKFPQMVFQDPYGSLNPSKTIGWIMEEPLRLRGPQGGGLLTPEERRERVIAMLHRVGLDEKLIDRYPNQLSGGQRQRICIGTALMQEPKLLIADEPTTALDVTIQAQILELMMELKDRLGMAIIMITHDLGVVASMCERIAVMYAGKIVEYGTTEDIFYHPKHEYTKGLIRSIPRIDTKEHERLVPIEGSPVDLLNPPKGCPFAPRCEKCMKICLREMPPVTSFGEVHYTQCWLNQKEEMEKGAANE